MCLQVADKEKLAAVSSQSGIVLLQVAPMWEDTGIAETWAAVHFFCPPARHLHCTALQARLFQPVSNDVPTSDNLTSNRVEKHWTEYPPPMTYLARAPRGVHGRARARRA